MYLFCGTPPFYGEGGGGGPQNNDSQMFEMA